jgi:type II secretory pathway component PulC
VVPTRTTEITRAQLDSLLAPGPGALLARVKVAAAARDGKFHGWRIVSLPPDTHLELQPGDVVRGVNGQGLERPEHLSAVWEKLRGTHEVVVDFEREGEARTWRLPVVE